MKSLIIILCSIGLGACGSTQFERTATGSAMGAVVGGAIGSLYGQPTTGALIGGGVGAMGGALSPPPSGPVYPSQVYPNIYYAPPNVCYDPNTGRRYSVPPGASCY